MTEISSHYLHFLVLADNGQGEGWYAPKEVSQGEGLSTATLTIPVKSDGALFDGYWAWAITLDEGVPRLLDEPFEVVIDGDELKMDANSAWVRFSITATPFPYKGNLSHPDFVHHLRAISPIEDEAYNLLFPRDKAVIIGVDSDEYR